ncbi:MAG: DUF4012 domain-containing protein [Candidatus Pacebacteria bacterium]|nr:DUF4012 domain-containing protein [Candidatus Paceibacterota bacterium]
MDIIPNKKSNLLYQKGDQKMKGVIDLRCFADGKRKQEDVGNKKNRIVSEIIRKEKIKSKIELQTKQNRQSSFYKKVKSQKMFPVFNLKLKKSFAAFILVILFIPAVIFSLSFIQKSVEQKGRVLGVGTQAYDYLKLAGQSAVDSDFENSVENFDLATTNFSEIREIINEFDFGIASILNNIPIDTPISTAENLAEAGENISLVGKNISGLMDKITRLDKNEFSLNSIFSFQTDIDKIAFNLNNAQKNIEKININYIPENLREKMEMAKSQLPAIAKNFNNLSNDFPVIAKIFGSDRPQKYLLLFQNSSEMRATGGFIGSYGILDIEDGKIKSLFIDGIFNPDGQLTEKIVPPIPIQKISAAWSMHDANWFVDFPTSAKKISLFYEKTGGPTVDGVIAITPKVLEKILVITGPIEMPEYNIVIDQNNFLVETQLQVEELYDKEENKPKQILADLTPKIIDELFNTENLNSEKKAQRYLDIVGVMEESFKEKHLLFYHRNSEINDIIIKRGLGGQILDSNGDYLSVAHSNINGYKTDAVIDEKIIHNSEVLSDGSVIDTVRIIRKHTGGENEYDWYNRVNCDYLRVLVPLGSVLLEARGHTWQDYEPPIDYSDFKIDPDVQKIEDTLKIDPENGTHIFEESGKTVFGNWVYVSPGETVEVFYKYKLPYKINFADFTKPADKYSVLVQKQSGSSDIKFSGSIKLPKEWNVIWNSENLLFGDLNEMVVDTDLNVDRVYGVVFTNE